MSMLVAIRDAEKEYVLGPESAFQAPILYQGSARLAQEGNINIVVPQLKDADAKSLIILNFIVCNVLRYSTRTVSKL